MFDGLFVFFFKQKTAYEMRISDWSSDVCSSDLLADPDLAHVPATRLENACATGSAALYTAMDFIESGRGRIALVVGAEKMTSRPTPEIGRASCRERVCQYV